MPDCPRVCTELSSQMHAVWVCHLQVVINVSEFSELITACWTKSRFRLLSRGSENKDQSGTRLPASYKKVIIITSPALSQTQGLEGLVRPAPAGSVRENQGWEDHRWNISIFPPLGTEILSSGPAPAHAPREAGKNGWAALFGNKRNVYPQGTGRTDPGASMQWRRRSS